MPQRQTADMERASQLKIALYGFGAAGAVAVLAALLSWGLNLWSAAELACGAQKIKDAMKIGDANGCLEFWFNRYQSLLGGLLALGGALTTIGVMRWQSRAGERASERAARAYVYSRLKEYLGDASTALDRAITTNSYNPIPQLTIGDRPDLVGHLPNTLGQQLYQVRAKTRAVAANTAYLEDLHIPGVVRYVVAGLAQRMLDVDEFAKAVAEQGGPYFAEFGGAVLDQLEQLATPFNARPEFQQVLDWLGETPEV